MRTARFLEAFEEWSAPVPGHVFIVHLLQAGFSPDAYRERYKDVAARLPSLADVLAHFLRHGLVERRVAPMTLDVPAFEALARLPIANTNFRAGLLSNLATHLSKDFKHPYGPSIIAHWPTIRELEALGALPFLVAGDSHTSQVAIPGARAAEWLLPLYVNCEAGSAAGLGNPHSRTGHGQALRVLMQDLAPLPGFDRLPILLQFGQVDVEFVYHFRRIRKRQVTYDPLDYRRFCDDVLGHYFRFLTDLFAPARRRLVFLVSMFPPAVSDDAWQSGWFNDRIAERETDLPLDTISDGLRAIEVANLRERTAVHLHFNHLLRARCQHHGFAFIDAANPFLGADGLLDPLYIVPENNGRDHHIDGRQSFRRIVPLICDAIAPVPRP